MLHRKKKEKNLSELSQSQERFKPSQRKVFLPLPGIGNNQKSSGHFVPQQGLRSVHALYSDQNWEHFIPLQSMRAAHALSYDQFPQYQ